MHTFLQGLKEPVRGILMRERTPEWNIGFANARAIQEERVARKLANDCVNKQNAFNFNSLKNQLDELKLNIKSVHRAVARMNDQNTRKKWNSSEIQSAPQHQKGHHKNFHKGYQSGQPFSEHRELIRNSITRNLTVNQNDNVNSYQRQGVRRHQHQHRSGQHQYIYY
jgi:hypothetical protein